MNAAMNAAVTQDRGEREQLKQAMLAYQSAVTSTVCSLVTPPVRPVRMVLDKKGFEASLRPVRVAQEEVVRRFASAAGVDEQTAKPTVGRLLKEVCVLAFMGWDKTADVATAKRPAPSSAEELASRSERLNAGAIDALIRFYLEDGQPPDDVPFAETRRAWDAYESQRLAQFRKRRRVAASERHRAAWDRWGAAQKV